MSKSEQTAYHHGNLRNALIQAGVCMLDEVGEQGLSMRKLAKQAGVSHNAPYMHFADKEAVLAAIAEEGFVLLAEAVGRAVAVDAAWFDRLQAGCWAYVQFALEHPSHLRVMFRYHDPEKYPSLYAASTGALALLEQVVAEGQQRGETVAGDTKQLATLIWSLQHGVATILAGRKMPPGVIGDRSAKELVESYVALLYRGLAPHDKSLH